MDLPTEIPSAEIPSAEASSELSGAFRDVGAGDGSSSASSSAPPIHQPVAAVDVSSVEDETRKKAIEAEKQHREAQKEAQEAAASVKYDMSSVEDETRKKAIEAEAGRAGVDLGRLGQPLAVLRGDDAHVLQSSGAEVMAAWEQVRLSI